MRNSATPIASGVASSRAPSDVIAVPKMKLPAPYSSWPTVGFHATRVTNPRPYFAEREAGAVDDLPRDEADEDDRAERRRARDHLQRDVAEADPPPREGAAGSSSDVRSGHGRP